MLTARLGLYTAHLATRSRAFAFAAAYEGLSSLSTDDALAVPTASAACFGRFHLCGHCGAAYNKPMLLQALRDRLDGANRLAKRVERQKAQYEKLLARGWRAHAPRTRARDAPIRAGAEGALCSIHPRWGWTATSS